jgi:hypothetical protein
VVGVGPGDGVGSAPEIPAALEEQSGREHGEEDNLFVTVDEASPDPGLDEGEGSEGQPADTGYQAVGRGGSAKN